MERYVAGEHMDHREPEIQRWGVIGRDTIGPTFHTRFQPGQVLYRLAPDLPAQGGRRRLRWDLLRDTTFVLEPADSDVLLQEFLPFVLSSESSTTSRSQLEGSVNPYVNWSRLAGYEFDLPPLDEQKRIADLLWAVERHRRVHSDELSGARLDDRYAEWLERCRHLSMGRLASKHDGSWQDRPLATTSWPARGNVAVEIGHDFVPRRDDKRLRRSRVTQSVRRA